LELALINGHTKQLCSDSSLSQALTGHVKFLWPVERSHVDSPAASLDRIDPSMFVAAVLSYRIMTPLQDSTTTTCCRIAKGTVPGVVDWQGRERSRVGRTSRIRPRPQVVGSDKTNGLGREAKLNRGVDELLHIARLVVVNVEGTKVNRDCSKRYCDKTSLARKEWM
jgi:hypothetical protein